MSQVLRSHSVRPVPKLAGAAAEVDDADRKRGTAEEKGAQGTRPDSSQLPGRPSPRLELRQRLTINPLPQFLAGLEMRNELLRDWHLLSGLRIPAGARRAVVDPKTAKPTDLDSLAFRQAQGHGSESRIDHKLGVLRSQLRIALGKPGNQVGFSHFGRDLHMTPAVLLDHR